MQNSINLKNILFIDIETVPEYASYSELPERTKLFWDKKSSYFRTEEQVGADVYQRAGIYAEFGKIICISVGLITATKNVLGLKLKSFAGKDEKVLLEDFLALIKKMEEKRPVIFCAHNGKEFDYPYISRRLLINSLPLPDSLNSSGKKPWEINHLDTLEMWKFGDYKHYTSLDLLTHIFNIPSPKDEIDGSMVADVYYKEDKLEKIIKYCENDVVAVVQLLLKYLNHPLVQNEFIERTALQLD
jgi:3'-5' exonuclease